MTLGSTGVTTQKLGSIVGYLKRGTIGDSYGIDQYDSVGGSITNSDSKKSLTELQNQGTFASWDFDIVWKMDTQVDNTPIFKSGSDINSISAKLSKTDYFVGEKISLQYLMEQMLLN